MADQEIQIKISADVQSLLRGMKDSQDSISTATEGMKGDLGSLIESLEKVGPAALALGAVGLAFEGLKEAKDIIMDAVHSTDELARSFETLHLRTGASYEDLTIYKNAMVLTGGSLDDFSGLLTGLARKMSANSEIYIANGIAASKSALDHQDLMTTLAKSVQVITSIEDPGRRAEMAIALLGGRAQAMLPQIMRMNEVIEKDGVEALRKLGATIDTEAVAKHERLEHAIGGVKLEIEKVDQLLADSGRGWAVWGAKLNLMWHQLTLSASDYIRTAFPDLKGDEERRVAALQDQWKQEGSLPSDEAGGGGGKPSGKVGTTQKELDAQKAAQAEKLAMAHEAAKETARVAEWEVSESLKVYATQLKTEEIYLSEYTEAAKAGADQVLQAKLKALQTEYNLDKGKPVEQKKTLDQMAAAQRAHDSTMQDLDDKAARHEFDLLKELNEQCLALKKESDKKMEAQEKAAQKINEQIYKETEKQFKTVIDGMTNGWDTGIQKMLHSQMSFKDGMLGALKQIEDQTEKTVINMGIQWVKDAALREAMALKAHFAQNQVAAKDAAANAYASAAEIPFVGWIIAPVAAAAAYSATIAFAEGGWDRVPADQVAMVHKNEMVLPANIAEPVRQMAAAGGGGGQTHIHIHAMDSQSFTTALNNNIGGLRDSLYRALRNGRLR